MIAIFGNCQARSLYSSISQYAQAQGLWLTSAEILKANQGHHAPRVLKDLVRRFNLEHYLNWRELDRQYSLFTASDPEPTLIVFTLFNEIEYFHINVRDNTRFYIHKGALAAEPRFAHFMHSNYRTRALPVEGYFERFHDLLGLARSQKSAPILILKRFSHHPAFGPAPHSYLAGWDDYWPQALGRLEAMAQTIPGCTVLDLDRLLAGMLARTGLGVQALFPFLRLRVFDCENTRRLSVRRDVEHVRQEFWDIVAEKVLAFQKTGKVQYDADETIPEEWSSGDFTPEHIGHSQLAELLGSGDAFDCARGLAFLIWNSQYDFSEWITEFKDSMPLHEITLSMMHKYAMISPTPSLVEWCGAQERKLEADPGLDSAFKRRYRSRLDEISRLALGVADQMPFP
ncbi:MAG: hypothetical protein HY795_15860 [Desulfovibrio sp.]|nr:hypothetical protein [Desulfovibrio sp.]MBI4958703.1 hypothetical protein [Desulfovibrio sp.]